MPSRPCMRGWDPLDVGCRVPPDVMGAVCFRTAQGRFASPPHVGCLPAARRVQSTRRPSASVLLGGIHTCFVAPLTTRPLLSHTASTHARSCSGGAQERPCSGGAQLRSDGPPASHLAAPARRRHARCTEAHVGCRAAILGVHRIESGGELPRIPTDVILVNLLI